MSIAYDACYQRGLDTGGDYFEEIIERTYRAILNPGDWAVDGGAHRGRHTLPLAECVGSNGGVLAVEVLPSLATALRLATPQQVIVEQCALGAEDADDRPFWAAEAELGLSSLRNPRHHPAMTDATAASIREIPVCTRRLDSLLEAYPARCRVGFVKLDLEGGELDALRGSDRLLADDRPVVIFECGFGYSAELFGFTPEAFFDFFAIRQYRLFDLFGRPFAAEHWGLPDRPWYLIAAPVNEVKSRFNPLEQAARL